MRRMDRLPVRAGVVVLTLLPVLALPFLAGPHAPYRILEPGVVEPSRDLVIGPTVLYLLAAHCECSSRAATHLASRRPRRDVPERILIAGGVLDGEEQLRRAGWRVETIDGSEARRRWGTQSAPLMIYLDEAGKRRYAGGFASGRGRRARYLETMLIDGLASGRPVPVFPAYGCSLSSPSRNWKLLEE
jgi:hypothetical protein